MDLSSEIIELLKIKNRCLDRLMNETRILLASPTQDLVREGADDIGPLKTYEHARASIIETLQMHDRRISALISELKAEDKTENFIQDANEAVKNNERLITAVFNADDVVFQKIAEAQSELLKQIQDGRKTKEKLSRFKSTGTSTGEEMDTTL